MHGSAGSRGLSPQEAALQCPGWQACGPKSWKPLPQVVTWWEVENGAQGGTQLEGQRQAKRGEGGPCQINSKVKN